MGERSPYILALEIARPAPMHFATMALDDPEDWGTDEPRCSCCGCWTGFGETALCDGCRYDEADRT
jgi:hypothetical protein